MQGEKHHEGFNLMIYSVLTKNLESSTFGGSFLILGFISLYLRQHSCLACKRSPKNQSQKPPMGLGEKNVI